MKINFEKPVARIFGQKKKQKSEAKPVGILNGELPVSLRQFAEERRSTAAKERSHYQLYLTARDAG